MNVVIFTPALLEGDGVGNDVLGMARALRAAGHAVSFSTRWESALPVVPLNRVPDLLRHPDDVFLLHHSIGCEEAVRLFEALPCRKIVKYHNVTPPHFFADINEVVVKGCVAGLKQVARLLRPGVRVWVDSPFNGRDLERVCPGHPFEVLPPFNQVDDLLEAETDRTSVGLYDDWLTNILVVGRLVPNKNVTRALEAFAIYLDRHDPQARLFLVGDLAQNAYCETVLDCIRDLGLADRVFITGKVSLEQLKAFYLSAQILLTTSCHEGFCLPLVEAMGLRVPIVALRNTAIPDTGGDVAVYPADDPAAIAAALAAVRAEPTTLEDRLDRGWQRYRDHFDNRAITARFHKLFASATAAGKIAALAR